ncbi:MAG TPA: hypothetical protein VG457_17215 [Planctomycetota bacterium]|jgi:pimeloyl-ACP methyl ester carboxylesterase|nr:hypothetical protein [Planctomycetota bacterium]
MNRRTLAFAILALPSLRCAGEAGPSSEATRSFYNRTFLVGHDIGFLLAYAYAAARPDEVRRLVLIEGVLPAIADRDKIKLSDLFWHFCSEPAGGPGRRPRPALPQNGDP